MVRAVDKADAFQRSIISEAIYHLPFNARYEEDSRHSVVSSTWLNRQFVLTSRKHASTHLKLFLRQRLGELIYYALAQDVFSDHTGLGIAAPKRYYSTNAGCQSSSTWIPPTSLFSTSLFNLDDSGRTDRQSQLDTSTALSGTTESQRKDKVLQYKCLTCILLRLNS